ncbi:protein of unknown function [Candidatus Methylacidiphilum fumarolicum]|uniref:Uncharacterized protein n=1 Tax=Candidatus Methylacidiphilum fumarolicum TaxID=591154 RepID=A0ABN8XCC1_9BACT|nr:protein of unknown function [Candidatus Methylacidiphilum fumarolicum]
MLDYSCMCWRFEVMSLHVFADRADSAAKREGGPVCSAGGELLRWRED